jgi:hypothetical protein
MMWRLAPGFRRKSGVRPLAEDLAYSISNPQNMSSVALGITNFRVISRHATKNGRIE